MFCINGNMGNMYLFTADGLFVSTLFHDIRLRPNWAAPVATRNMDVTDVSLHDENFWPSITQTADGACILSMAAAQASCESMDSKLCSDLPETTIDSHGRRLAASSRLVCEGRNPASAAARQRHPEGADRDKTRPQVDGQLDDWPATTDWASIDRRGTKANFNSNSRPYEVSAAVALTDTHLYAAWRTTEKEPAQQQWRNSAMRCSNTAAAST